MFFGEKPTALIFYSIFNWTLLTFVAGGLLVFGLPVECKDCWLPKNAEAIAQLHSIVGGLILTGLAWMGIGYINHSSKFQKGIRIIPRHPTLEEHEENFQLQRWVIGLMFGVPILVNNFYWIRIFKANVYLVDATIPGGGEFSRFTLKSCAWLLHDCYRLGNTDGVQYLPFISDVVPVAVWLLVIWSAWRWQYFYKNSQY